MEEEKSLKETHQLLSLSDPQGIMDFGKKLKEFIIKNSLSTKIGATEYAHVDGWKFAGMNFGLVAIVGEPIPMHGDREFMHIFFEEKTGRSASGTYKYDKAYMATTVEEAILLEKARCKRFEIAPIYKYKCNADIINVATEKKVGAGSAICSSLELIKSGFDEYAVSSMAQTRAIGKAFRNLLGFVMNTAGYAATPAEEMSEKYGKDENGKVKFGNDVQSSIDLLNTIDELMRYYNQLPELHDDIRFTDAMNKRKNQIKSQK